LRRDAAILVIGLAGGAVLAGVSDDEQADGGLEEHVIVEASLPDDVAAFATTIETEDVRRRGQDLADLLRRVPGARVHDYGGLGSYATVSLRGSTSEQVTVLVDGVKQNRALGGPVDISSIPTTQLESIRVYRGFAPASSGVGGMGGVIDVRTITPGNVSSFSVDLLAGGQETQRLSSSVAVPAGDRGMLRVGVEAMTSRGDFDYLDSNDTLFNPMDDTVESRRNNDLEQISVLFRHVYETSATSELVSGIRLQDRERGVPGLDSTESDSARSDESVAAIDVAWNRDGDGLAKITNVRFDGFREEIHLADPLGDLGAAKDQTTRMSGGGVTDLVSLGRVTVAPSIRWEYLQSRFLDGGGGTVGSGPSETSDGNLSGKIGVVLGLTRRTVLRGSLGQLYRNPSLAELFGDRGAIVGNRGLDPERGRSIELGVATRTTRELFEWNLEAVAFGRRSEDLIRLSQLTQGVSKPINIADADVFGLELSGALDWSSGLFLDASATLQHSEETSGIFSGNPLPYQPERLAFVGAGLRRGAVNLRWEMTYVGENSVARFDPPEVRVPSRVIHDASFSYLLPRGLELGIDVRNVFDRRVRDVSRYPLPSRVVFFHVGWQNQRRGA
jgi:outer membrane cobalamin receptor